MATSYKCPNCAASLIFDADQQKMVCEYCGAEISPEDIVATEVHLNSEAMKREEIADEQIHGGTDEARGSSEESATEEEYFSEEDSVQFVCNSCGAAVITDKHTSATFCAFCGSPAIIPERLVDARKPDYVLPFKYGRENAIEAFFKWCKAGRFTPIDFVKKENVEKMTGLYVPFWLFDQVVDMDYEATGTKVTSSTSSNKTTTRTKYYKLKRKRKVCWSKIPFDGATHIDDEQMELIAPFEYKDLEAFNMVYLSGFYADRYDVPAVELEDDLQRRIFAYVEKTFENSVKGYKTIIWKKNHSKYYKPDVKYALLPVWVLNYNYNGKRYTFAMNGQTGKTAGEYPISKVKLSAIGLAILPLAAIIFKLVIGGVILGGFF